MDVLNQYKEFLEELREELNDGTLANMDKINILRSEEEVDGYKSIVDWYYDDITMRSILQPDEMDTEEDKKELIEVKEQYLSNKPDLEAIVINDCIEEMEEYIHTNR